MSIPPDSTALGTSKENQNGPNRRHFLYLGTAAVGAAGVAATAWPLIDSMNPASDALALATVEVNIASIQPGQMIVVTWQGKPTFIRRRTEDEIKQAQDVDLSILRDPEPDSARVQRPEWLILVGVCTHLGCVPIFDGNNLRLSDPDFGGWFCSCHGSQYDTSGRIRKGPAPYNLPVPHYSFLSESVIRIG
jgi:ubiquinol-cytochrome c reductase iron-sulfur subunit